MSGVTRTALGWGIQLQTMPLLLAIDAHEASEPARLFFSLLRLRARSSTLVLTPPSSIHRATIASLPIELVDEILACLHRKLRRRARMDLIKKEGKCPCGSRSSKSFPHTCGIDCPSWIECCREPRSLDDPDHERFQSFEDHLNGVHDSKVSPPPLPLSVLFSPP
ncbi:hypothetical protein BDY24DRAFT_381841 [Mrakia frigida]|uniref:uncharacterized protein n=1 Tax=Mrakia frigida TaxID=29902 RepID=UPI003FCBF3DC